MSPPNFFFIKPVTSLLLLLLFIIYPISSSPLSTVAVSHISNLTLVCALIPSISTTNQYDLNCTSFPNGKTHHYPAGLNPYTAIAAGDGFLCGLISSSNTSTMRWWDFAHNPHKNSIPDAKRVYIGPALSALSAGDSHVCGLTGSSGDLNCWRWPQLNVTAGLKPVEIAVGGSFVCGLLKSGEIKCFGADFSVVGKEPNGSFVSLAAGSSHACGISVDGRLVCWGFGAPEIIDEDLPSIDWMALGNNKTCVLDDNAAVHCWGDNVGLPEDLVNVPFVAIHARGDAICGVLMTNYSLVCWGSKLFYRNHVAFKQVLPGVCATSCPCLPLAGTGNFCGNGAYVCRPCPNKKIVNPSSNPNSTNQSGSNSSNTRRRLIFIILGSIGFVIGLIAVACFLFHRFRLKMGRIHDSGSRTPTVRPRPERNLESQMSQLFHNGHNTTVEEFPIKLLLEITDGFSDKHKIGSGSFGTVYRATLDDGRIIAIKRAESSASASTSRARTPNVGENHRRQNKESAFCSEIALLSRINHKNLVRLFGYCKQGSERIIVYEFMTNGTLHDLLHRPDRQLGSPLGSWAARICVALDAARGIEYLHSYAVPPIIHRDIKSSNILLDDQWMAKVSDFGLSLMSPYDNESNVSLCAAGTVGYMDPEYYRLQHLTAKSDVYSFGVVMLEILSGCRVIQRYEESGTPRNVVEFAVPHIATDDICRVLDPRLAPPTPSEIEAVAYMSYLAADCVSPEGRDRPTMSEIVNGLERALVAISGASSMMSRSSTTRSSR